MLDADIAALSLIDCVLTGNSAAKGASVLMPARTWLHVEFSKNYDFFDWKYMQGMVVL